MATAPTGGPIRLTKTAFVIYYHVDLVKARAFLLDFGLTIVQESPDSEIFFAGYGVEPFVYVARKGHPASGGSFFGGAAYVVESRKELQRAAETIPGASTPSKLTAPGGGEIVTLTDPAGHKVHLVHGQVSKPASPPAELKKLVVNYEDAKPRVGRFQRFEPGPAPVYRWGHYGVTYPEGAYQAMFDWYTQTIALRPSDFVHRDGKPITCFFHIDHGQGYTDHHSFFFKPVKPGQEPGVAHAAFEVHDFDVQQLGHNHLEAKGYELCWGVGRVSLFMMRCKFGPFADLWSSTFLEARSSTTGSTRVGLWWSIMQT